MALMSFLQNTLYHQLRGASRNIVHFLEDCAFQTGKTAQIVYTRPRWKDVRVHDEEKQKM